MVDATAYITGQNGKVVKLEMGPELLPEFTSNGITEVGFIAQPDLSIQ